MSAQTHQSTINPATAAAAAPVAAMVNDTALPEQSMEPLQWLPVQRQLTVGAADDPLEKEADDMAGRVMRMPEPSFIQRKCAHCGAEEKAQRKPLASFIQKKAGGTGNTLATQSVSNQISATQGGGQTMPSTTRSFMESRFETDFSGVRIHTGDYAAQLSSELSAQAFTVGNDIYFNSGKFSPETTDGQHLLAHELTHTIQQQGATIRKFGSDEHRRIGDSAVSDRALITSYGTVTFGEMIAMAGDYFESIEEIASLAESWGTFGREQIDYVLWKVNPTRTRPTVSQAAIDAVEDRYNRLAARNETHFSTGSSAGNSNRERYTDIHTQAMIDAFSEGLNPLVVRRWTWQAREGFAQHFLTDAFSAGHVRTQRGNIQRHWNGMYPGFVDNMIRMISCYMASHINERDNIGYVMTVDMLTEQIIPVVRSMGGSTLTSFSIGDLISKVLHDADNAGLDVVSSRGPAGSTTGSPFHWRTVGDNFLFPAAGATATTPQQQTQQMLTEAITLSFQEGRQAYSAGVSADFTRGRQLADPANFRAPALFPAEDTSSTTNPAYAWRAADLPSLPANIQTLITNAFLPGAEIRNGLDALTVPCITSRMNFDLHTGDAFECFRRRLIAHPWDVILEIAAGGAGLCPPGQNDPCPALRNPCP